MTPIGDRLASGEDMSMAIDRQPGDAEAEGAVAGMRSVYGRPSPTLGQWVTGTTCGRAFSGTVASVEPGSVGIRIDEYSSIVVRPSDLDDWA